MALTQASAIAAEKPLLVISCAKSQNLTITTDALRCLRILTSICRAI